MGKKAIRYAVVDAFAAEPFKGNPAAVCLLEEEHAAAAADDRWMQAVAAEFNLSETAFLARDLSRAGAAAPRFHLRWFTPVTEVDLCGHATLASAHFLFTTVLAEHGVVEFMTRSGILTAKKVPEAESTGAPGEEQGKQFIELDFPRIDFVDCNSSHEMPSIPKTLNGAPIISVHKSATDGDLIVELSSGEEVVNMLPNIDEIKKLACRGLLVTGPAPAGSGYDIFTRFFCPKFGINEDPVTGSVHCVLAPYWGGKLGKQKLKAFQASPRGGTLYLELDDENQRVRIQGEAVTVMAGTLLA
ncbi:uncharacterized protein LOC100827266 [Brachypodium distachyon]|uniref:Phenazine biosynthesis protein n=1 Tax=Brachypodium distachyon TaxID=15368 RepID=I1HE95_BRADI|nr:uncharacterized protein LOC100827266 [Brachypodium distachyon]KQK03791.1 hypothetical protein BRADI_2g09880v3 [Brachypodium distachyon]|eukprot:XP_003566778.1 uncharacterized protein LOC100827266 [Brachypodium distachyon]